MQRRTRPVRHRRTNRQSVAVGRAPPCVWYQFTDRKGEHPVKHLSGYQGWVHADGYAGFKACSVKVKPRKWPAWPTSDASLSMCLPHKVPPLPRRPQADCAIVWCGKTGKFQSPEARAALRQENAKPIFDLEEWLRDQLPKISGITFGKGIRYALGRMPKNGPTSTTAFSWTKHRRTRHEARR